jgi:hypothetical protein
MGGRRCYRNMDRQLGVYFLLPRFDVARFVSLGPSPGRWLTVRFSFGPDADLVIVSSLI